MTDLHHLTAVEQVALLRSRELTSRELTEHYLSRIAAHDGGLRSFCTVFADEARAAADAADAGPVTGALHGLPLGLKDLHPTVGLRTTMGSAALAEWAPAVGAPVVEHLRAEGVVVLGKTNAPELGPTCYTENAVGGATLSPYGAGRSPSGSSGGAAVAVAAGLQPVGHASDGLGSIRTPAAACGLVGHKPSRGRFAGSGGDWIATSVEGPVARTVADAALLLDALPHPGRGVLWPSPAWEPGAHTRALTRPLRPVRIGVHVDPGYDVEVAPACLDAVNATADALRALGHEVVDVPPGALPGTQSLLEPLIALLVARISLGVEALVPPERRHLLMPLTSWLVERGPRQTSVELARAETALAAATSAWVQGQSAYDVLLTPTTTDLPLASGALRLDDAEECCAAMLGYSAFTPWANLTGHPGTSLPVAEVDGQPVGVQLMAANGEDERLLALAASLEPVFGWADRHPPAW